MPSFDPSGLGNLLGEGNMLRFSSAVSDHCQAIAMMFNATNDCDDEDIIEACENLVYLQCWPHLIRKVSRGVPPCVHTCAAGHTHAIREPSRQGFHEGHDHDDALGPD